MGRTAAALPSPWAEEPALANAASIEASPIVGIHVWYDRQVMDEEFVAVVDSPLQWVFNKSRIQRADGPGQYVCVSLSGAWDYAPMSKEALRQLFTAELERVFPVRRAPVSSASSWSAARRHLPAHARRR